MKYAATVFLSALASVQALPASTASNANWLTTRWDVIVVGAGPAGIIVADRMSEAGVKTYEARIIYLPASRVRYTC